MWFWFWFYLVHPMTVGVDNVGLSHTGHQLSSFNVSMNM